MKRLHFFAAGSDDLPIPNGVPAVPCCQVPGHGLHFVSGHRLHIIWKFFGFHEGRWPGHDQLCPMYDSRIFCQGKWRRSSLWWLGRCQGRRTLAFISTLDTAPATLTIVQGAKLRCSF